MSRQQERSECGCNDSNCAQGDVARRDFIKLAGLGTFGAAATGLPVMAGPFDDGNAKDGPIPIDKKLDAKWIASLYRRGEPTTYRGWDELKFIGMPVGGIAAGTVYLGGDGQLWCWDIFNEHHEGCIPNRLTDRTDTPRGRNVRERDGANYIKPTAEQWSPWEFLQGFVLKAGDRSWALNRNGFDDISFTGQYPVGTVKYRDPQCPVEVDLEAFTPFIPLDAERSSYPATVMQFTVRNGGSRDERVSLAGFLENAVLRSHSQLAGIERLLRTNDAGFSCHARREQATASAATDIRDEILFADFEQESWDDWQAECSDHYARAMSSYGVFLAACGFEYDGPRGHLGIAPRLGTDEFSAAFTAAEGWGTVSQQRNADQQLHQIKVAHGRLQINSFSCELAEEQTATTVSALVDGQPVDATHETSDGRVRIELREQLSLSPGQVLELRIGV